MPIYEFSCLDCGTDFERIQSFSDKSLPVCPSCHGHRVQRRLSPPAIHFKGSGWYITDSKNAGKSGANGKNSAEKGESAASDAGKSDTSKPETATAESKGAATTPASTSSPAKSG